MESEVGIPDNDQCQFGSRKRGTRQAVLSFKLKILTAIIYIGKKSKMEGVTDEDQFSLESRLKKNKLMYLHQVFRSEKAFDYIDWNLCTIKHNISELGLTETQVNRKGHGEKNRNRIIFLHAGISEFTVAVGFISSLLHVLSHFII